jgi:drug/metabolite transporter (DMT)-like permease
MKRSELVALIETAAAISLWALSFVFIKIALGEISPMTLIFLRYAMGGLILGVAAGIRGDFARFERSDLTRMFWLGLVGIFLQQLLQVNGQITAEASVAAFLASTAPAFMVILTAVFLRGSVKGGQILGVLLATSGGIWVATGGAFSSLTAGQLGNWGNWLVLASSVVWAVYTILTHYLIQDRPPILIAAGMLFWGWLFSLPFFIAQNGWHDFAQMSSSGWGAVIIVGVFSTALTYLLYSHALKLAPASRLAAIQNIEPLIATIAAVTILNEKITPALIWGGIAILAGVYLAEQNSLTQ